MAFAEDFPDSSYVTWKKKEDEKNMKVTEKRKQETKMM